MNYKYGGPIPETIEEYVALGYETDGMTPERIQGIINDMNGKIPLKRRIKSFFKRLPGFLIGSILFPTIIILGCISMIYRILM